MLKGDKREKYANAINPSSPIISSSFSDLIAHCKSFRQREFIHLSTFTYKQLQEVIDASFRQVIRDCVSADASVIISTCFIIDCLRKLCADKRAQLITYASKLASNRNDQVGILISYVTSKLYNKVEGFLVRSKLEDINNRFDLSYDALPNAYFLLFLAQHSPEAILLNWELFLKIVLRAVYHKSVEIRNTAADAIREYVSLVIKRPEANLDDYVMPIFQIALNRINDVELRHGNLLLFSVLLEKGLYRYFDNPEGIINLFQGMVRFRDEIVALQALYCFILSSHLDKEYFYQKCWDTVTRLLIDFNTVSNGTVLAASSFLLMVQQFNEFLPDLGASKIFQVLRSMLCRNDPFKQGFELLEIIGKKQPSIIARTNQIFSILASTPITAEFAKYVPPLFPLFHKNSWEQFKKTLCSRLAADLIKTPTVNHLNLISSCEPLDSSNIHAALLDLLNHPNSDIRANTPKALLQNAKNMACLPNIVNQLLIQSLSEKDGIVRAKTLQSFPESTANIMSSSSALSCFESLANDECYKVRKNAMILLAKIVTISPFAVLPILRRVLLDDLFLLNSQRGHRLQKDMTKLLLHLISAAQDILPIYSQSICQIAIEHFNSPPRREQTIFERESFFDISTNISKCINIIAKKDINLVSQYFNEFIESFMLILKQHNKKELKIAVVEALTTFVSNCGSQFQIDRKAMFTELTSIASKWNSHKLNLAFLKLFGLLGAVDINILQSESEEFDVDEIDNDHHKYYLNVVCRTLLGVLQDNSLNIHHSETTKHLVSIFALHEESSYEWYLKFMPLFINEIRNTRSSIFLSLLQHLCQSIPPNWLTCFTDELIGLIYELWGTDELLNVLGVVSALASVLMDRFAPFLPQCISLLLDCLFSNKTSHPDISQKVLESLVALRYVSSDYMFLIIPEIVATASNPLTNPETRIDALHSLRIFIQSCECENFAASIVRCVIFSLSFSGKVRNIALQVLYSLQVALGSSFAPYQDVVLQALDKHHISSHNFHTISGKKPPLLLESFDFIEKDLLKRSNTLPRPTKFGTYPQNSSVSQITTTFVENETPWNMKEWFKKFVESIIFNSPETCIRFSSNLAANLPSVSESLFNAAFLSCWEKMNTEMQNSIRKTITDALMSRHISENARSLLVNLIEFMDRAEVSIGIPPQILCIACRDSGHHARAFYFAHRWFQEDKTNQSSEVMIKIASTLGLRQTVIGLSEIMARGEKLQPSWWEQLGNWQRALDGYSANDEDIAGKLRCMAHLMMWNDIVAYLPTLETFNCTDQQKSEVASSLIAALYNLHRYSEISKHLEYCSENDTSSYVFAAIAEFKNGKKDQAFSIIERAFDNLARRAQTMFKHDKSMLYSTALESMKLTELSEIINDKMDQTVWNDRLSLCRKTFDVIYPVLTVRFCYSQSFDQSVLLLKRALKLALKTNDWNLFSAVEKELFTPEVAKSNHVMIIDSIAKWEQGRCSEALDQIMSLNIEGEKEAIASKICFLRGQWILRMTPPNEVGRVVEKVMPHLIQATNLDPLNYKAWHRWAWATANIFHADNTQTKSAIDAISGFMQCVQLRASSSFSDLLQMISIFFMANLDSDSFDKVSSLISTLDDAFILRISQHLFAQLKSEKTRVSKFVADLIKNRLPRLFHVMLYPILLLKRGNVNSVEIANDLLQNFRVSNPAALHQAEVISNGLFKASCLRIERRIDLLVNLSKKMKNRDFQKMLDLLNKELEMTPISNDDRSFERQHSSEFKMLAETLQRMTQFSTPSAYNSLLKLLKSLYDKLKQEMKDTRSIKLSDVSPELADLKDSVLAVPGTYNSTYVNSGNNNTNTNTNVIGQLTTITNFHPVLEMIPSKQYPRLVVIVGSDGCQHSSLLKGQEDLRLDQQVMQFFELMNMHIANGFDPELRSLRLHNYAITPLSKKSGLIQFLDNTDTLFKLIVNYRQQRNMKVFIEEDCGKDWFAPIEPMTPVQRLEFMRDVNQEMPGNELREVIWLKSGNAMNWISRTTRFAQTSAVVSIVGYILGLGDRHPSNIMMHKYSGDVIHIDFGDCFEISRKRLKFPEQVPFRLTRMIRNAFGPSGIEGEFRLTCEQTMKLIRGHRESIMAVLNIFLQVPLEGTYEGCVPRKVAASEEHMHHSSSVRNNMSIDPENPNIGSNDEEVMLNITAALERITDKIVGKDFENETPLEISEQVGKLIDNATDDYNLSVMYPNWKPFW